MDRDRRITGSLRGQSDKPIAPLGFELNNPWRVCFCRSSSFSFVIHIANPRTSGRETDKLDEKN
ncbi:hypothetical protein F5X99DRAFT_225027 [Biscogniauxia marginata]|nr:hypothetical protein F5X99DRAFT_225027 [Biscogniauxia marginata]